MLVRRLTVGVALVAAGFLAVAVHLANGAPTEQTSRSVAASPLATTKGPPKHLVAVRLKARPDAIPVGTQVSGSKLFKTHVFSGGSDGFALAEDKSATYPARTVDGGRVWRINGPQFHINAADAPQAVTSVGIVNDHTYYAYGSQVADVTTNAGRTWWETSMGFGVAAVVTGPNNQLLAYVYEQPKHSSKTAVWQYVSTNGGRSWRYTSEPF